MGKYKTNRTDELRRADERMMLGDHVLAAIEQHNFDRLMAQGVIVEAGAFQKSKPPKAAGVA